MTKTEQDIQTSPERKAVEKLVNQVLTKHDLYLIELIIRGHTGSQVVEVYIDSEEGPDVDQLSRASRELGFLFEVGDIFEGKYNLTVSSPGLDRLIVAPRQYKKLKGKDLEITVQSDGGGRTRMKAKLVDNNQSGIVVDTANGRERYEYTDIIKAKVVLPW